MRRIIKTRTSGSTKDFPGFIYANKLYNYTKHFLDYDHGQLNCNNSIFTGSLFSITTRPAEREHGNKSRLFNQTIDFNEVRGEVSNIGEMKNIGYWIFFQLFHTDATYQNIGIEYKKTAKQIRNYLNQIEIPCKFQKNSI